MSLSRSADSPEPCSVPVMPSSLAARLEAVSLDWANQNGRFAPPDDGSAAAAVGQARRGHSDRRPSAPAADTMFTSAAASGKTGQIMLPANLTGLWSLGWKKSTSSGQNVSSVAGAAVARRKSSLVNAITARVGQSAASAGGGGGPIRKDNRPTSLSTSSLLDIVEVRGAGMGDVLTGDSLAVGSGGQNTHPLKKRSKNRQPLIGLLGAAVYRGPDDGSYSLPNDISSMAKSRFSLFSRRNSAVTLAQTPQVHLLPQPLQPSPAVANPAWQPAGTGPAQSGDLMYVLAGGGTGFLPHLHLVCVFVCVCVYCSLSSTSIFHLHEIHSPQFRRSLFDRRPQSWNSFQNMLYTVN
ncbi:unnamed protein product [Protopolystoma xenopodis]|uniref:Uncharacterized protein n=1 Tax=Protopolystoma xenopodis TaxID=117903 RepID=A0A448WQM3_9PLAT|nr:unnamed protein product [Protopolystoma xenopodis]